MNKQWMILQLQQAMDQWTEKLQLLQDLLTQDPTTYAGGQLWAVVQEVQGNLTAVGMALTVLFFLMGNLTQGLDGRQWRQSEWVIGNWLRFALVQGLLSRSKEGMQALIRIGQGISGRILAIGIRDSGRWTLPTAVEEAFEEAGLLDSLPFSLLSTIGTLAITVLSFALVLLVSIRFFRLYLYLALAPIPLATFSSPRFSNVGAQYLRSFCGLLLEGALTALACVLVTRLWALEPALPLAGEGIGLLWQYVGETVFRMVLLVMVLQNTDALVQTMFGL